MIRGPVQRKGPLPGKIFARCILQRRFAGHFGCMARRSCQSQPVFGCMARESCHELAIFPSEAAFGMHGAQNLPRIAARGRTAAESCHGKTPGSAPRENIATVKSGQECIRAQSCHRRTLGNAFREHLPSSSARERTAAESCHCQSPENAFRAYPAIAGHLGTHSVDILPSADIRECTASAYRHCQSPVTQRSPRGGVGSAPWLCCGVRRATLSVQGSGHSAFSGLNCWERFRVCAVSVGNHEPASRSAKLCRIMC